MKRIKRLVTFALTAAIAITITVKAASRQQTVSALQSKGYKVESYTVQNGDTLDGIGYKVKSSSTDIRQWRYEVEKINKINADLQAGQQIIILVKEN